jgi:glutamate 5-kinase
MNWLFLFAFSGGNQVMEANRIVVKVGSSSLTDDTGRLSMQKISELTRQIAYVREVHGSEVVLVSSGSIACGKNRLGWLTREITLAEKQAAAAVGQGVLMNMYEEMFAKQNTVIGQVLLTKADFLDGERLKNTRRTMDTLLRFGVVPIVNENDTVAVDEIRFGDNDTLSSLVARLVSASKLVLLTDIDGFYTANPQVSKDAKRIEDVFEITAALEKNASRSISRVGTGGMKTKLHAAKLAIEKGIDVFIASAEEKDVIIKVSSGERTGTWFHARPQATVSTPMVEQQNC